MSELDLAGDSRDDSAAPSDEQPFAFTSRSISAGASAAAVSSVLYVLWRPGSVPERLRGMKLTQAMHLGDVLAFAIMAGAVMYTLGAASRSPAAGAAASSAEPSAAAAAAAAAAATNERLPAPSTPPRSPVQLARKRRATGSPSRVRKPAALVPEERLFAELIAGGAVASASLEQVLGRASQIVGLLVTAGPVSPPGASGVRRSALRLLARLQDVAELAARPVWCDRLATCGRGALEELAALLAYVEEIQQEGAEVTRSAVVDLKLVSEVLDSLERHTGGGATGEERGTGPHQVRQADGGDVEQLRDTVEQLAVQMSLMERSFGDEVPETSAVGGPLDVSAQVVLSEKIVQLQADLSSAAEQHSAEQRQRAEDQSKLSLAAQKLEEVEALAEQRVERLQERAAADRRLAAAEADAAASKAALELFTQQLPSHATSASPPPTAANTTDRSPRGPIGPPRRSRSPSPQSRSRRSPSPDIEAQQLREICHKLTLQELWEEAEIAGIDVEQKLDLYETEELPSSEEQKDDLVELLVENFGLAALDVMAPVRSNSRGGGHSNRSMLRRPGVERSSAPAMSQREQLLELQLAETQRSLYSVRESMVGGVAETQEAQRRAAATEERMTRMETVANQLVAAEAAALTAKNEAEESFSKLMAKTEAELTAERTRRELAEERVQAAERQRQEEAAREAAAKAAEQAAAEAEAAQAAEDAEQAEEAAKKAAAEKAALELTQELARVSTRLAELEAAGAEEVLNKWATQAASQRSPVETSGDRLRQVELEIAELESAAAATDSAPVQPVRSPPARPPPARPPPAVEEEVEAPPPALQPYSLPSSPRSAMKSEARTQTVAKPEATSRRSQMMQKQLAVSSSSDEDYVRPVRRTVAAAAVSTSSRPRSPAADGRNHERANKREPEPEPAPRSRAGVRSADTKQMDRFMGNRRGAAPKQQQLSSSPAARMESSTPELMRKQRFVVSDSDSETEAPPSQRDWSEDEEDTKTKHELAPDRQARLARELQSQSSWEPVAAAAPEVPHGPERQARTRWRSAVASASPRESKQGASRVSQSGSSKGMKADARRQTRERPERPAEPLDSEPSAKGRRSPSIDAERVAQLQEIYTRADRDGDGRLTRAGLILRLRKDEELRELLKLAAHVLDGERDVFEKVFQGMDVDDDRCVSHSEFVRYLRLVAAAAPEVPQAQAPAPAQARARAPADMPGTGRVEDYEETTKPKRDAKARWSTAATNVTATKRKPAPKPVSLPALELEQLEHEHELEHKDESELQDYNRMAASPYAGSPNFRVEVQAAFEDSDSEDEPVSAPVQMSTRPQRQPTAEITSRKRSNALQIRRQLSSDEEEELVEIEEAKTSPEAPLRIRTAAHNEAVHASMLSHFQKFDTDGDGLVSFEEFCKGGFGVEINAPQAPAQPAGRDPNRAETAPPDRAKKEEAQARELWEQISSEDEQEEEEAEESVAVGNGKAARRPNAGYAYPDEVKRFDSDSEEEHTAYRQEPPTKEPQRIANSGGWAPNSDRSSPTPSSDRSSPAPTWMAPKPARSTSTASSAVASATTTPAVRSTSSASTSKSGASPAARMAAGMAKGPGQHRKIAIAGAVSSPKRNSNASRLRQASWKHRAAKQHMDLHGKLQVADKAAVAAQTRVGAKIGSAALVQRNRLAKDWPNAFK